MTLPPCPRCARPLRRQSLGIATHTAYREVLGGDQAGFACDRCALGVIPGPIVETLMRGATVGGKATERNVERTRQACPTEACFGSLERVVFSWGTTVVEVERCPRCHALVLDAGEFPKLFTIESSQG